MQNSKENLVRRIQNFILTQQIPLYKIARLVDVEVNEIRSIINGNTELKEAELIDIFSKLVETDF